MGQGFAFSLSLYLYILLYWRNKLRVNCTTVYGVYQSSVRIAVFPVWDFVSQKMFVRERVHRGHMKNSGSV